MQLFVQTLINGVLVGSIYATFTLGFQLAFGVLDIIDLAVGGWIMLGGYTGFWLSHDMHVSPILLCPIVFAIFAAIGLGIAPLIYRVRQSRYVNPPLMALAFTFGLFILMQGVVLTVWGFNTRSIDTLVSNQSLSLGPFDVPTLRLIAFVFSVVLTGLLFFILYRTRFGLAVRAVAQNKSNAGVMGVDVRRVSAYVYAIYAGLTAVVGVLLAGIYSVSPGVGAHYTLFAFFVSVLAGLGSVGGVLVAGLALGLLEALVSVYWGTNYTYFVTFIALYAVLIAAPHGLLSRRSRSL